MNCMNSSVERKNLFGCQAARNVAKAKRQTAPALGNLHPALINCNMHASSNLSIACPRQAPQSHDEPLKYSLFTGKTTLFLQAPEMRSVKTVKPDKRIRRFHL
jgi:hypothetical protein